MTQSVTEFTVDWAVATKRARTKTRKIRSRFCGIPYTRTLKKHFPERVFDSRNGDKIPSKGLSALERQLSLTIGLDRLYLYPGQEPTIPTFGHVTGRVPLRDRETLMAMLKLSDGTFFEIAADKIRFKIEPNMDAAKAHIVAYQEFGFMIYDGIQPQQATLSFRDYNEKEKLTAELFSRELIEELPAA